MKTNRSQPSARRQTRGTDAAAAAARVLLRLEPPRTATPIRRPLGAGCVLMVVVLASLGAARLEAQTTPGPRQTSHVWLDSSGTPLPFQANREIVEYLRSAEIVDRKRIGQGTTGAERVLLDRGGVRVRAALRTFDRTYRGPFEGYPPSVRRVRDAGVFECAAYELSEALGIGRVPPTACRQVDRTTASLQIWFEHGMTQSDAAEKALAPPDMRRWELEKDRMQVFDALIANLDRNQGNIMIDSDWSLWFIDHTRAFTQTRNLVWPDKVTRCNRALWLALRNMDEAAVRQRLQPVLTGGEISALFKRRDELVDRIDKLIATRGEAAVLFDLD
jgi:hypothetical protein